MFVTDHHK